MLRTQDTQIKRHKEATNISHSSPEGLLPIDQTLVINLETRTISLLSDGPTLIVEQQLSINELHLLVPILESFPHYCPYEVLLSHLITKVVTEASIERCRQHLREAQDCGRWEQELRPVRRALSSLRNKLYRLDLGISNIRERGCGLISLATQSPETQQL
ncbi:MAG TPA: hypothetical protein VF043_31755 [Ktedonobacteraceae bacterium]